MKIEVLVFVLIQIHRIQSRSSNDSTLELCQNASTAIYENYTNAATQNCGCENPETCIRKCCREGFFYNHEADDAASRMDICSKHDSKGFSVPIYDGERKVGDVVDNFVVGMLNCNETGMSHIKFNESDPTAKFFIQNNGTLYHPHYGLTLDNGRYCLDEGDGLTVYLCFKPKKKEKIKLETIIHVAAKIISVPFLMATGIVYALLPERNLHRAALMLHVFSLLVGNALLAVGQYSAIEDDNLCFSLGYSILLFMVASFFWMNVICIDIWLAFSGLRGFYVQEKIKRKIFAIASLYAWGFPALNVLIVFLINSYGDENANYHPAIGVESCFLRNGLPTIIFYFVPILLIILINIGLFILTALNIQKVKKETRIMGGSQSKKHSTKEDDKFKLYWKLLFVMGLNPVVNTHIIQMISWSLGRRLEHSSAVYIWYYKDFSHAAYGILIFVIFVCQKKIFTSLRERYPCKCKKDDTKKTSVTTSTNTTSNSDQSAIRLRGIRNLGADVP